MSDTTAPDTAAVRRLLEMIPASMRDEAAHTVRLVQLASYIEGFDRASELALGAIRGDVHTMRDAPR